ncbi:MAG: phosphoesterase [Chloroflexi bacterium]|nr:phosphoesterase [Chloroflexota bacterium]
MLHRAGSRFRSALLLTVVALSTVLLVATTVSAGGSEWRGRADDQPRLRAAPPPDSIRDILVIELENESFSETFGPGSPATYLNGTLRAQGELLEGYFATGHASLDNYISQISGQAPTSATRADCSNLASLAPPFNNIQFSFTNVTPGGDDPFPATNPGQVDGQGCVYPPPSGGNHGAPTIADQLDAKFPPDRRTHVAAWRDYDEDMGNVPSRDGGSPDPSGGTDCAHPPIGGVDNAEIGTASDQYATRHNPFVYFHTIIDNAAECNANVVPLGTLQADGTPDPAGHLARDLRDERTTPRFGFITPNVCNDGHDSTCAGPNSEGGHTGGLAAADLFLKHWLPLILNSPAYREGSMLVVITFDEGGVTLTGVSDVRSCCYEQAGPNVTAPGDVFGRATTNTAPGGGQTGAVLLNRRFIRPGSDNTTGTYNHYSALRSYEDLLGLDTGGADGAGHVGFAAAPGLVPFGPDVFNLAQGGQ